MKKISKKQLCTVLLFAGLVTGGNCMAKTPEMTPEAQELKYRVGFFNTIIGAFNAIINAPAEYIKNITSIKGLDENTKKRYINNTTRYISKYAGLMGRKIKDLETARNNAQKQLDANK